MPETPEPLERPSVFISYSRQDAEFAFRVQAALAAVGIRTWVDQIEIMPGTADWEDMLRDAIKQSRALILIASPTSRKSLYVKDELQIARDSKCPVYPLWVLGEVWSDAIPLGWGQTQYIDARGTNEQPGLQKLVNALNSLMNSAAPLPPRLPEEAPSQNLEAEQKNLEPFTSPQKPRPTIISLAIAAARALGADHHAVSLAALHAAYLKTNPDIKVGKTPNSFANILAFHTINMRSRFFYPNDKRKSADWLTRPVFKRIAYGQYMLLSDDEIRLFRQRVEEDDPRIYQDEYDINDLR